MEAGLLSSEWLGPTLMGGGNSDGVVILMLGDHQGSSISTWNMVLGLRGSLLSWINRLLAAARFD
jgi:hypothetical protein